MIFFLSLIFGYAGAHSVFKWGHAFGIMDYPTQRSSHASPVPKGGGVGLLVALVVASLWLKVPLSFSLPIFFVSFISLFVDRFDIKPTLRLLAHFMAALVFLLANPLGPGMPVSLPILCFLAVFMVGTTNFYNFMDGINGIAGIAGIIAFSCLSYFAVHMAQNPSIGSLSICLSLACFGFLPLNLKSKVFMGDVGSILLGFTFAAFVIFLSKNFLDFITLTGFLFPFYADELITMSGRIKNHEKLTQPHRRHIYQALANECGIAHWKISLMYGMIQLIVAMGILHLREYGVIQVALFLLACFICVIVFNTLLRRKIKLARPS